jgi:hypothetical protein
VTNRVGKVESLAEMNKRLSRESRGDINQEERMDYERRILAAECGSQRILNNLEEYLRWCARCATFVPDALDPRAAEILTNVANAIAKVDVTDPDQDIASCFERTALQSHRGDER